MTTVVYTKGILATDSRITNRETDSAKRCLSCGEKAATVRDNGNKITLDLAGITYNDEPVAAIGQCGFRAASIAAIEFIKSGKDIKQYLTVTKDVGGGNLHHGFALVIVTTKSVWVLTSTIREEEGYREKRYSHDDVVVVGSGRAAALLAIEVLGVDAINAVRAAAIVDPATGGDVKYVKFDQNGAVIVSEAEKEMEKAEAIKLLKAGQQAPASAPKAPVQKAPAKRAYKKRNTAN